MFPLRKKDTKTTLLPDGHAVIIDEIRDLAITLNPLGAAVWEFCDGCHSQSQIAEEIQRQVASPIPELERDIGVLMAELAKNDLISWQDNYLENFLPPEN